MSGKIYHRILSAVVCVSLLLNSLWGVFLYPRPTFAQESPSADFEFNGLTFPPADTEFYFNIKVKNLSGLDDTTFIRYKATTSKDGSPLSEHIVYYEEVGEDATDPSNRSSITTDLEGVVYFGPPPGFPVEALPDLKTETGVTSEFATTLSEGQYSLTLDIIGTEEQVYISDTFSFSVDETPPTISIGSGNGNLNTGPAHFNGYNGLVEVYATVLDPNIYNYHFRIVRDGNPWSHSCGGALADSSNQGYGKCGYAYNQVTYEDTGFNDDVIATIDTTQLGADGAYWLLIGAMDEAGNRADPNWLNDPRIKIFVDNTAPAVPTGLKIYKSHNPSEENLLGCGGITNDTKITIDWDPNTEEDLAYYWLGTKFDQKHKKVYPPQTEYLANMNPGHNPYYYTAIAVDEAENESLVSDQCGLILDQDAPDVETTFPVSSLVSGTVPIRGSVNDANPHHYWLVIENSSGVKVAGPGEVNDSSSFTDKHFFDWGTTSVPSGTYIIKLEARDAAKNKDDGSVHWKEVVVDNTPPETDNPLDSPESGSFWNEQIQIQGTSTDNFLTELLNLSYKPSDSPDPWSFITSLFNPENDAIFDWSFSWTPTAEGTYNIMAAAVDAAGNEETSAYAEDITYDVTAPSVPVLTWPIDNEFTNDNTPLMQWNDSTDGDSGVVGYYYIVYYNCSNPAKIPNSCNNQYVHPTLIPNSDLQAGTTGDGVYYWQVRAKDNAGNLSDWSELEKVTIDTIVPIVPGSLGWGTNVPPSGYQGDGLGISNYIACGGYLRNDGNAYNRGVWGEAVENGSGVLRYERQVRGAVTYNGNETTNYTSTFIPGVSGGASDGVYYVRVRAIDNAGNTSVDDGTWDNTSDYQEWCSLTIDTQAPFEGSLVINGGDLYTNSRNVVLIISASDNLSGVFEMSIANNDSYGSWEPYVTIKDWELTDSDGEKIVRAKFKDMAGNETPTPFVSDTIVLDRVDPTSQPTSPGPGYYNADTWNGTVEGTASDDRSGVNKVEASIKVVTPDPGSQTLYWDGDSWEADQSWLNATGTDTWDYNLAPIEGIYTFYSRATDNAGNIEFTGELTGIIYDTTKPELTWISPVENTVISGTTVILSVAMDNLSGVDSVTYYYQRDGEADWELIDTLTISPYEYDWDTTGLKLGTYNLKAVAKDKAGNFVEATRKVDVAAVISDETWNRPEFGKITVSWTTDRATSGRVVYDTTSHSIDLNHLNYGYANTSGVVDSSPKTTNHTVTLSELLNGITYYWRTVSTGSPIVISKEHRGDTFSIPSPGGDGEGAVAGLTADTITTTTPFITGEIEGVSISEEEEEVLGEETATITQPEDLGGFGESVLGKSKIIRVILWGGATLGGLILIYFFFRRRKRR